MARTTAAEKAQPVKVTGSSQVIPKQYRGPANDSSSVGTCRYDFSRIPVHAKTPFTIQPKLTINTPGDEYEREADRISEQVMRTANTYEQFQTKRLQPNDSTERVVPPIVPEVLSSPGRPLDTQTRAFMERRFGHDFSRVRVHTDARADQSARALGAIAYAGGPNVVFRQGRYEPTNTEGRRLLAHELAHVVQQHNVANSVMRQTTGSELAEDASPDVDEESVPRQYEEDAALDAAYDKWIHYDPEKDAEETAIIDRINNEIFGPVNRERNQTAADSFENTKAKEKAFPTGVLETSPSLEREKLFNTPTYRWLHSDAPEDKARQESMGVSRPLGDIAPTGKLTNRTFGAPSPEGTIWDYRGGEATTAGGTGIDSLMSSEGISGEKSVLGYAEFKDSKGGEAQKVYVPQLGFGKKPPIIRTQIMCQDAPVVAPGRAKRRAGPTGEKVTGRRIWNLYGRKRFFGKGTGPTTTGKGQVLGERAGPGKPVYWYYHQLPEQGDDPEKDPRDKIDEIMQKKADKVMSKKEQSYEQLQEYYLSRAAFIAKYQNLLK